MAWLLTFFFLRAQVICCHHCRAHIRERKGKWSWQGVVPSFTVDLFKTSPSPASCSCLTDCLYDCEKVTRLQHGTITFPWNSYSTMFYSWIQHVWQLVALKKCTHWFYMIHCPFQFSLFRFWRKTLPQDFICLISCTIPGLLDTHLVPLCSAPDAAFA